MVVLGASSSDARYTDSRNLYRWIWTSLAGDQPPVVAEDTPMPKPTDQSATTKPRAEIVLTDEARKLHAASIVIDGHNNLPWEIRNKGDGDFAKFDISQPQPKVHTDIPRLREGGVGAQFWSVWVPVRLGYEGSALLTTIEQIELVKKMVETYPQDFELATTVADIKRIHGEGKIASLIGVEGGHCIEDSISNLNHLFELGARYMTLTHADSLDWADSATDQPKTGGLSPFGKQVIERMNHLGMMVDISHVSPETMHAVLDVTKAPVIFSHSSARAVADSPRNVPDDVLKRIKEDDGVVMVNYFSAFVVPEAVEIYHRGLDHQRELSKEHEPAEVTRMMSRWRRQNPMPAGDIHDVLDHIDHLAKVAGWQHIGLGADYDGVGLLPKGLEDVSTYPYITQGLLDRGYTEEQITGILGENLLRVMGKVEEVGEKLRGE
jgi:membrane dipeptidase